ncbi:MAG: thioester reductase domain-containing protein [Kofleriaceae bacterium]|nr:thioester reductase domain-containing protein [Kofleriaceae bacterium]
MPAAATTALAARLAAIVGRTLGRPIGRTEPLAAAGVDSLAAAEILAALGDDLGRDVPLALWFAAATIDELAVRLTRVTTDDDDDASSPRALAIADLAAGPHLPAPLPAPRLPLTTVLLTGATGFLGAHLVEALIERTALRVACLVRATDDDGATARLAAALARHGIAAPPPGRVRALAGDLAAPAIGLAPAARDRLAAEVDAVVHAGAVVSWLAPYAGLRAANVGGTRALLELAASGDRARPFHLVSTISTAPADGDERTILDEPTALASTPYALSKWIAEVHARRAAAAGLPLAVYRPALVAGHGRRGGGNPDDFLHRYLAAVAELGLYLDLADATLDMTPVDFVAGAIAALLIAAPAGGDTYHLANVDQSFSYARLGRALVAAGVAARPAPYAEFRAALLAAPSSRLAALASFFPAAGFALGSGPWPCARTVAALAALGVARPPVDDALVARYVRASLGNGPR